MEIDTLNKKAFRIVLYIIGTIVLGALGSGVWEKLLSPASENFISVMANFFSTISVSFKNSIYSNLGEGSIRVLGIFSSSFYFLSSIAFGFSFISAVFILNSKITKLNKKSFVGITVNEETDKMLLARTHKKEDIKKMFKWFSRSIRFIFFPIIILFSFYLFSKVIKDAYRWDLIVNIDRSIEVVAPYVSDNELKQLKSDYRLINDYISYNSFIEKVDKILKENNIVIPK